MHSKKSNITQILLSVTALILIVLTAFGTTFSWIEGGTNLHITNKVGDDGLSAVKTAALPTLGGTVVLDPTLDPNSNTNRISLLSYDETSSYYRTITDETKPVYFTPMTSSDGKTFRIHNADANGNISEDSYRDATTNDIGTQCISFSFDFIAKENCYLAVDQLPVIAATRGGAEVDESMFSAFRFAFTYTTSNGTAYGPIILSRNEENQYVSGFSEYLDIDDTSQKLFTFLKDEKGTIDVAIWLDALEAKSAEENRGDKTSLIGCKFTSFDLNLIVGQEKFFANFNAVSYDSNGSKLSNGFTGGTITIGNESITKAAQIGYPIGSEVKATAVPNTDSGYLFDGWYSDSDCTKQIADKNNPTFTDSDTADLPAGDKTSKNYYAKFKQDKLTTTIYFEARKDFGINDDMYAFIYNKNDESIKYGGSTSWPGNKLSADGVTGTGYYYISFETEEAGQFRVIVNNDSDKQYPGQNQPGLEGTLGKTYLFTNDGTKLTEFKVSDATLTFKVVASPSEGGDVKINDSTEHTTVKIRPGDDVKITSAPNTSTHIHAGWFSDSNLTDKINDNYMTHKQVVTISGSAGDTVTYRAKYSTTRTIYFDTSHWNTGGAKFGVHIWNSSGSKDLWMSKVSGNIYSCEIPIGYNNIIFMRLKDTATSVNWDNTWNQTADLTIPTDKNKFKINNNEWNGGNGTWSTYNP